MGTMLRLVDGVVFEGKPSADRWRVSSVDLGHGHIEGCVQRCIDWSQSHLLGAESTEARVLRGEIDDPDAEHKREANLKRAARRAKANVRRRCKAQGLDTLLTLTYRVNQTDRALAELHLKLFLEKVRANFERCELGQFAYVGCFEPQKRGAWHVHLATHRLPRVLAARNGVQVKSFNVLRAMWRAVVGELGGTVNVGRHSGKSAAKCAAYISKYVLKMFEEGADHSKRFRWSRCEVPERVVREVRAEHMTALIAELVGMACAGGRVVASSWLSRFGDVFFVAGEVVP